MVNEVIILGGGEGYQKLFQHAIPRAKITQITKGGYAAGKNSLVVLTDGESISPSFMADLGIPSVSTSAVFDTNRDKWEYNIWKTSWVDCKFVGIGRGSHMLWVLRGGSLYIQLGNHRHNHDIHDLTTGEIVEVQSSHGQAIKPDTGPVNILAVDQKATLQGWYDPSSKHLEQRFAQSKPNISPEILTTIEAWSTSNYLGIQFRPDLSGCPVAGRDLFYKYLQNFLSGG